MIKLLRLILYPISLLYGLLIHFRNWCYNQRLLYVYEPKVKTIAVGNLSSGGTGKTPHIEYLIRLLEVNFKVATLSRGYGRKTRGFKIATLTDTAQSIGDEPMQYFQKFMDIIVAVDAKRRRGIKKLTAKFPMLDVVLLDDAFQHRSVKAGLNIILSDYAHMYYDDKMLPTGNLREFKSGINRADVIIISKTPAIFSPIERRHLVSKINALPHQKLFFSYIKYHSITHFFNKNEFNEFNFSNVLAKDVEVLVFAGIANPSLLEDFVRSKSKSYKLISFDDHYQYSKTDLEKIKAEFEGMRSTKKIILTTEKDAMRLIHLNLSSEWHNLPLFFISIAVQLHQQDEENFNQLILNYVRTN
ncbi:MAG TPA: tetraacyldisaccharide 4'-kinase [Bacteroidia bacterium]|nr:tetraacyldisaccharide 4'-kinase [Bacteroidia bacterium]